MIMLNHRTVQSNTHYNTDGNSFLLVLLTLLRVWNIYLPLKFEKRQHSQIYVNISKLVFFWTLFQLAESLKLMIIYCIYYVWQNTSNIC